MHLLYLALSWRDDVSEIREQFPLELSETIKIADHYGIKHPMFGGNKVVMTSDFLVDFIDGTQKVYSVKATQRDIEDDRTAEKLFIEKTYWAERGIDYVMLFKDTDVNEVYANNIRSVMAYYDINEVHSLNDLIMYLIAHKIIVTDMSADRLPIQQLKEFMVQNPGYLELIA